VAFDRRVAKEFQTLLDLVIDEVAGAMKSGESREHLDVEMCRSVQRGCGERLPDRLADRVAQQQVDHRGRVEDRAVFRHRPRVRPSPP
jgi:hypothetical protein